ncbi:hypothetical protein [Flaviaesturariibacter amylovorans]|uniref:Lipocalin-like domain-containing protein n=1 Tax=Flaviaesturariibacter amylovorans TaxID=1084520 RepID=A0ABP8GBW5_9BACT
MKRLLLFLLLLSGTAAAQDFPEAFVGHWKGTLHWYSAGKKEPRTVTMQLLIGRTDTAGQYTWRIVYGDSLRDDRPYVLRPADSAKGHWLIDERNGILLDQYWVGGRLTSAFSVQSSTIHNAYWLEGGRLIAEFHATGVAPVRTSGHGTEASPEVKSFPTKSYQRAVLERMR